MMNVLVSFSNETDLPTIDEDRIRAIGLPLLAERGLTGDWIADVRFVTIETMRALNREAQGLDEPTDVLSFPVHFATDRSDPHHEFPLEGPQLLGSIVISPAVAANQAPGNGRTTEQELEWLIEHAVHHLLGEDHDDAGHWRPRLGR